MGRRGPSEGWRVAEKAGSYFMFPGLMFPGSMGAAAT